MLAGSECFPKLNPAEYLVPTGGCVQSIHLTFPIEQVYLGIEF